MVVLTSSAGSRNKWLQRVVVTIALTGLAVFIAIFTVIPGPVITTDAEIGDGVAFATIDGRDVVLVAYDDLGFTGIRPSGASSGVTAIDLETGKTVWEKSLPESSPRPEVLAAGETYAYVRHAWGLVIVSLEDGETLAYDETIDGLGDDHGDGGFYAYDPGRQTIVAATNSGELKQIPIDQTAAVDTDQPIRDTWQCLVGAEATRSVITYDQLSDSAETDAGTLNVGRLDDAPAGLPTRRLLINDAEGSRELSATEFYEAGLVNEVTAALPPDRACVGAEWPYDVYPDDQAWTAAPAVVAGRYVVVEGASGPNSSDKLLTVVDTESGETTATVDVDRGFGRAVTAPTGQLVLVGETKRPGQFGTKGSAPDTDIVLIVDDDGSTREIVVTEKGWFGR